MSRNCCLSGRGDSIGDGANVMANANALKGMVTEEIRALLQQITILGPESKFQRLNNIHIHPDTAMQGGLLQHCLREYSQQIFE